MAFRAKLKLSQETVYDVGTGKTLKFTTEYDDTIPEDQRFHKFTPTGSFEMFCTNPVVLEQCKLGQKFYVDFTPVE